MNEQAKAAPEPRTPIQPNVQQMCFVLVHQRITKGGKENLSPAEFAERVKAEYDALKEGK